MTVKTDRHPHDKSQQEARMVPSSRYLLGIGKSCVSANTRLADTQ